MRPKLTVDLLLDRLALAERQAIHESRLSFLSVLESGLSREVLDDVERKSTRSVVKKLRRKLGWRLSKEEVRADIRERVRRHRLNKARGKAN